MTGTPAAPACPPSRPILPTAARAVGARRRAIRERVGSATMDTDARRKVPSVDGLLRSAPGRRASASLGRPLLKATLARTLDGVREAAARGIDPPSGDEILAQALARASTIHAGLTPVINAAGVVLHTGLGRAPMPEVAARAAARAARSYADLEVDRASGPRRTRPRGAE